MRVLIFSDSHGDGHAVTDVLLRHPDITTVIHLGDGAREAEDAAERFPNYTFYIVRGNCDYVGLAPDSRFETIGGKKIFLTHGHRFNVKFGLYTYDCAARERGADVALFGHTHQPFEDYHDGMYLFNPGSLRSGSYGIMDVSPSGVIFRHMKR